MADKMTAAETARETASVTRLVLRAQAGDMAAFDQLMIGHQQRILALGWRMLGNRDDARDAAQETFLRVYKHLRKFDPAQDFAGWLYRIAVNVCHDLARKRRRNVTSFEAELEAGTLREPASAHNTEKAAQVAQEHRIVTRALATLTEKERAAIVLRDMEGLPTEEVARLLGSTPTTVRSQICAARAKIKSFRERWIQRGNKL